MPKLTMETSEVCPWCELAKLQWVEIFPVGPGITYPEYYECPECGSIFDEFMKEIDWEPQPSPSPTQ
jgi:hypothetical protein